MFLAVAVGGDGGGFVVVFTKPYFSPFFTLLALLRWSEGISSCRSHPAVGCTAGCSFLGRDTVRRNPLMIFHFRKVQNLIRFFGLLWLPTFGVKSLTPSSADLILGHVACFCALRVILAPKNFDIFLRVRLMLILFMKFSVIPLPRFGLTNFLLDDFRLEGISI